MLKKTKIICTMGPSEEKAGIVEGLIENGMNIARFNFSHGSHDEHGKRIQTVREAASKTGEIISLMLDTKGPEMRLGRFTTGKVQLVAGKTFILVNDDIVGDKGHVSVSHKNLYQEVKTGDIILLSDGLVSLRVEAIKGKDIVTIILNHGEMSDLKRVAVPGVSIGLPPVSERDIEDILYGISQNMDFVAASFIQRAEDVDTIRKIIVDHGGHMEIISKIENMEGVHNIDAIIAASDGIMVARGDLGVEVPSENVPMIQKQIIEKCNELGKPVIVATQMLESMVHNPRPTRAESSDVANAILDGADAIMLSGETANGEYPIEAVKMMNKIAQHTEASLEYKNLFVNRGFGRQESTTDAIAHATVQIAYELDAAAIITPTESGYTAEAISRYRPKAEILAVASNENTARHLNLRWGIYSIIGSDWNTTDEMIQVATKNVIEKELLQKDDVTVITSGITFGRNKTSAIQVHTI